MPEYSHEVSSLYDGVPAYATRGDVQFYCEESKRSGGKVLEVGCGTGRVLLPIARSGVQIHGLDASPSMLDRCETRLSNEPEEVRSRVTLAHGEACGFDLQATFDLVIAPFRVLQHLVTVSDQLAFLGCVAQHLAPGGRLIFDVFNPNFRALINADGAEREDTPETLLADGRMFRRTTKVNRLRWVDQVSEVELIYYVSKAAGKRPERIVQAFDMRWFLRAELVHLLERRGFQAQEIYGDFDRSPLTDLSPEQVVVAGHA